MNIDTSISVDSRNHLSQSGDINNETLPFIVRFLNISAQGSNVNRINDDRPLIDYSVGWDFFFVPEKGQPPPGHTFHSTAIENSSLNIQFNGTQIFVVGLLPPGDDLVCANYSIDGGPFISKALDTLTNESLPLGNSTYFVSEKLPVGTHNLSVVVINTGRGRNFSLDFFDVLSPSAEDVETNVSRSGTSAGVIAAGVLAAFVFGIIMAFVAQWIWKRARSVEKNTEEGKVSESSEIRATNGINPYDYAPSDHLHNDSGQSTSISLSSSVATEIFSGTASDGRTSPTVVSIVRSEGIPVSSLRIK